MNAKQSEEEVAALIELQTALQGMEQDEVALVKKMVDLLSTAPDGAAEGLTKLRGELEGKSLRERLDAAIEYLEGLAEE